ncbi:MAG: DUF350 domain-containing protein [Thermoanaerobaculia bacterium]
MVSFNFLVLLGGLLAYLVSIIASTALVLLFFRLNARLMPGKRVIDLCRSDRDKASLAPAIVLGSATLSQAYLLRHAVFVIMTMIRDFLVEHGNTLFAGTPFSAYLKLISLSILFLSLLSLMSVISIWLAGFFFSRMTGDMDEMQEIVKGNVAVAILFSFVLFSVTAILNEGLQDFAQALIPYGRSGAVRLP